jgi:hypothetical protein
MSKARIYCEFPSAEEKYHPLCPEKIELIEGRMFWSDEEQLNMLVLLLENVGINAAVRMGDPHPWKQTVAERVTGEGGVEAARA